jgi:hypothetical protein
MISASSKQKSGVDLPVTTMKRTIGRALRNCHVGAQHPRRCLSTAVPPDVQITTLPNKIRVATDSTPAHFSSVGLFVDGGACYETPETSGVSHFIDRMAFKVNFHF